MDCVTYDFDSEPGSWADALRFVPWIEDRDGTCFRHVAGPFRSPGDSGQLRTPNPSNDAGGDHTDRLAPAGSLLGLHAEPIATNSKDNPRD